jgi:predicted alpha/beta-fold hydrolase
MAQSVSSALSCAYSPKTAEITTAQEKSEIILSIVSPILLIIALSLTIHYAVYPVPPMVVVTPTFAISLPILICGPTTAAMAVVFIVQLVRHRKVRSAFENSIASTIMSSPSLQSPIRFALHPEGRQKSVTAYAEAKKGAIALAKQWSTEIVHFLTRDNVKLAGYWYEASPKAPTVILFHGNAMSAEDMVCSQWRSFYHDRGFNILVVEYRGYGLSEGEAAGVNQEMEAYFDAEAALKFVYSKGIQPDKVIAHGYSLGGAYATALGYFFQLPTIILQNTFTTCAEVMSHASGLSLRPMEKIVGSIYKNNVVEKNSEIPSSKDLVTDGFDSLSKVKKMWGNIFVISGKQDTLMPMRFAEAFIAAQYAETNAPGQFLAKVDGAHGDCDAIFRNKAELSKLEVFLLTSGFFNVVDAGFLNVLDQFCE